MKKVIMFAAFVLLLSSCSQPTESSGNNCWEYKILEVTGTLQGPTDSRNFGNLNLQTGEYTHQENQQLTDLGNEGWELVSVVPITETNLSHINNEYETTNDVRSVVRTSALRFYFKRKK